MDKTRLYSRRGEVPQSAIEAARGESPPVTKSNYGTGMAWHGTCRSGGTVGVDIMSNIHLHWRRLRLSVFMDAADELIGIRSFFNSFSSGKLMHTVTTRQM
jgi:hypothetical protein